MIDALTEFIREDFDYFNQTIDIIIDNENNYVDFCLSSKIDIDLTVSIEISEEMEDMDVVEWRETFNDHLQYELQNSSIVYHDYELFLSRMMFKEDMESFKLRTRNKIQQEKVLSII